MTPDDPAQIEEYLRLLSELGKTLTDDLRASVDGLQAAQLDGLAERLAATSRELKPISQALGSLESVAARLEAAPASIKGGVDSAVSTIVVARRELIDTQNGVITTGKSLIAAVNEATANTTKAAVELERKAQALKSIDLGGSLTKLENLTPEFQEIAAQFGVSLKESQLWRWFNVGLQGVVILLLVALICAVTIWPPNVAPASAPATEPAANSRKEQEPATSPPREAKAKPPQAEALRPKDVSITFDRDFFDRQGILLDQSEVNDIDVSLLSAIEKTRQRSCGLVSVSASGTILSALQKCISLCDGSVRVDGDPQKKTLSALETGPCKDKMEAEMRKAIDDFLRKRIEKKDEKLASCEVKHFEFAGQRFYFLTADELHKCATGGI